MTMATVGRPLLFTSLVLAAGFSGFLISIFAGPRNFAWSSMLAFSSAIIADFMLVPVLLKWLKPFKQPKPDSAAPQPSMTKQATAQGGIN